MIRNGGFTLIEMMITIAIVAILAALAAPSLQQLVINNRIVSDTNLLIGDLALARGEALKRGARVTVCTSSDGATCTGGTDWSAGRLVFVDEGVAGTVDGNDGDAAHVLRVISALNNNNMNETTGFSTPGYVSFFSTGFSSSGGALTVCHSGSVGRNVSISVTGRTTVAQTAGSCP